MEQSESSSNLQTSTGTRAVDGNLNDTAAVASFQGDLIGMDALEARENQSSRLLEMPPETLRMICAWVIGENRYEIGENRERSEIGSSSTALIFTSRQLHLESAYHLYRNNSFRFTGFDAFADFADTIPPAMLGLIRHVEIYQPDPIFEANPVIQTLARLPAIASKMGSVASFKVTTFPSDRDPETDKEWTWPSAASVMLLRLLIPVHQQFQQMHRQQPSRISIHITPDLLPIQIRESLAVIGSPITEWVFNSSYAVSQYRRWLRRARYYIGGVKYVGWAARFNDESS